MLYHNNSHLVSRFNNICFHIYVRYVSFKLITSHFKLFRPVKPEMCRCLSQFCFLVDQFCLMHNWFVHFFLVSFIKKNVEQQRSLSKPGDDFQWILFKIGRRKIYFASYSEFSGETNLIEMRQIDQTKQRAGKL